MGKDAEGEAGGSEADATAAEVGNDRDQVLQGPRQPIEPRHHEARRQHLGRADRASTTVSPQAGELLDAFRSGGQAALVAAIERSCRVWLAEHGWGKRDIQFQTFRERFNSPPEEWPVAAIIASDDDDVIQYLFSEGAEGFWEWGDDLGLAFESLRDAWVWQIPGDLDDRSNPTLCKELYAEQLFEWNAQLVAPDYTQIYHDVLLHLGEQPGRFRQMDWRAFEQLCASVFDARGYTTVLGPGRNDGGIDIRLTNHPVYGEQLTVVSVKRRSTEKITLELAASILGVAHATGADRSMIITSSTFLPSARKFAATSISHIPLILVDGQDVAAWCRDLIPDREHLKAQAADWTLEGAKIVVTTKGYNMYYPVWAAVMVETPGAARLIPIPSQWVSDWMNGSETPNLQDAPVPAFEDSFTARRNGDVYVADDGSRFTVWDGRPQWSSHAD